MRRWKRGGLARLFFGRRRRGFALGSPLALVGGAALGAGSMFVLDPERGRARRYFIHDKALHFEHAVERVMDKGVRDLRQRARGIVHEAIARFREDEVPDDKLVARVRSVVGRAVSHPHAVHVEAHGGRVILSGPVLSGEADRLLERVARVRGVGAIEDRLERHAHPGHISSLQGVSRRRAGGSELTQEHWTPALRLLAFGMGAVLLWRGLRRGGLVGTLIGTAGGLALARATVDMPLRRLTGLGAGRRAVDFQRTVDVHAPIERVFELVSRFEDFPRFMSHVREVRRLGGNHHRWRVAGPAGVPVEFDTVITRFVPNELIAWKTVEHQPVEHAGLVRFERLGEGITRVQIRLSYNPLAGALGHFVASLFGKDPKHVLDDDMLRFKSLLEQGKTRAHGERVTIDELLGEGEGRGPAGAS